jgi:tetratricopeptide (TPR) repeat protein
MNFVSDDAAFLTTSMHPRTRRLSRAHRLLPALLLLLAAAPADAQRRDGVPRRPRLAAAADTNDARAYFRQGQDLLQRHPGEAADAFYWASQIDPAWADPLYGRYAALLMADSRRLVLYYNGDRRTRLRPEVLAIDSLHYRALRMDPFLRRQFDREMIRLYVMTLVSDPTDLASDRSLAAFYTETVLADLPPLLRGRVMAGEGRLQQALQAYDEALRERRTRRSEPLRVLRHERGRMFALAGNDSMALVELGHAVEAGTEEEEGDELVWLYDSKAVLEHSRGMVHERMGDFAAARDAYARALVEDLSYHPAHVRLGALALAEGDTATALLEMGLAVDAAGRDDPATGLAHAALLARLRRLPEAEAALEAITEAAPYYADAWFLLGLVRDWQRPGDSVDAFRVFLDRARRDDPRRAQVQDVVGAVSP